MDRRTSPEPTSTSQRSNKSLKTRKEKLEARLVNKNLREEDTLEHVRRQWEGGDKYESYTRTIGPYRKACKFVGYSLNEDDPTLSFGFCCTLIGEFEHYQAKLRIEEMDVSKFCSRVIDACVEQGDLFPPSFSQHRDLLRRAEKDGRLMVFRTETSEGRRFVERIDPRSLRKK